MEFMLGGLSSCSAVLFTFPFDVLKTRQQLEHELATKGSAKHSSYSSVRQSIVTVIKTDGFRGLYKGLPAGILYQFSMNSARLGTYHIVENLGWTRSENALLTPILAVFWGGVAGLIGATASCPVFVAKTQLQAFSKGKYTAKFQHKHDGVIAALRNMYREAGVKGLYRGYTAHLTRVSLGSSVQMTSFAMAKDFFVQYEIFQKSVALHALAASSVAGLFMCLLMSPVDVVTTRMTNQGVSSSGQGLLYKNIFDCFVKIYRSEGIHGMYKGMAPLYMRVVPHTVLNLTFWEFFKKLHDRYSNYRV
nr:solute carrier family 25 member 35-like [Aedes albopictus]